MIRSCLLASLSLAACVGGAKHERETRPIRPAPDAGADAQVDDEATDAAHVDAKVTPPEAGDAGFDVCLTERRTAELSPLDLYILLDRSVSMHDPSQADRWSPSVSAIEAFLALDMGKVSVGLGLFPVAPSAPFSVSSCSFDECGPYGPCMVVPLLPSFCEAVGPAQSTATDSCVAGDYQKPVVELSELATAREQIGSVLALAKPEGGGTPTVQALSGALDYLRERRVSLPDHQSVLILATDGDPSICAPHDLESARTAVAAGFVEDIPTFVVGISADAANLTMIAEAGGTDAPILLGENVQDDLAAALTAIRDVKADCEIELPAAPGGQELNPRKVNVTLTPPGSEAVVLPRVHDDICNDAEAWRYDAPDHPTRIDLCPRACARARESGGVELHLELGCETILL
jgi:hypothetical protein